MYLSVNSSLEFCPNFGLRSSRSAVVLWAWFLFHVPEAIAMNRILCYLKQPSDRQQHAQAERDRINDLVGDVVETFCPDEGASLGFFLVPEIPNTSHVAGAAGHLASELRSIADKCERAAFLLEGKGGAA